MSCKWIDSTLGEYITFKNGKTSPDRDDGDPIPVFGSNGIIGYSTKNNAPDNSLVIGRVGSYCGSVYHSPTNCWVTDNAIIGLPKHDAESEFWYFLLLTLQLNSYRSGSGQPLINQTTLKSIPIRIPEESSVRSERGKQLYLFNQKIELNNQLNQTLEQIAQAIFKSWFVDFEPVKAKMTILESGGTAEQAELAAMSVISAKDETALKQLQAEQPEAYAELAETAALFPSAMEESELGDIPEGWEVESFSKIATLDTTSVKPNNSPDKVWEHFSIPAFDVDQSPVKELGSTIKSGKYKVKKTAVLSSKLNPHFPRTWWPDINHEESAICSTEFMQFIPLKDRHRAFMYCLITSGPFQEGISQRVTGTTGSRQRAQPPQVAAMEVVIPHKDLIGEFSRRVLPILKCKSRNIKQNNSLSDLRDTLLPKLLSGDLSIPESEKTNEEALA